MGTTKNASPSTLVLAATTLDYEIMQMERLSETLAEADLTSPSGQEHAAKLLERFSEHAGKVGVEVPNLAQSIVEAQQRAERAAAVVAERATQMQRRREQSDILLKRFEELVGEIRVITGKMNSLKSISAAPQSPEERAQLIVELTKFGDAISELGSQMQTLKTEAKSLSFKHLERDIDALTQSLGAAQGRLATLTKNPELN